MTVIIGYVDKVNKQTYMSCDSCASNAYMKVTLGESKIYQPSENPNFLIGGSGDGRVMQLISAYLNFPREEELVCDKITVDEKFIVRSIIPSIQKCLKDNLYTDDILSNSTLLLAYKDNLWRIGYNFQLISTSDNYQTIGSGSIVANGVLEALKDNKINDLSRIVKALKISSKMAIGVEGPYHMYLTGKGKLSEETMRELINDNLFTDSVTISSVNNNYIKKITDCECSIDDIDCKDDKLLFMTKSDLNEIYFIDFSGNLCCIKSNGDLIFNIEPSQDLYTKDWNMVELNAKGKRLLETISTEYPLLKIYPIEE